MFTLILRGLIMMVLLLLLVLFMVYRRVLLLFLDILLRRAFLLVVYLLGIVLTFRDVRRYWVLILHHRLYKTAVAFQL